MNSLLRISAVSIILLFIYAGCSYNPGPNNLGPGKTVPAKPGSTYTFKNVQTDTTGKIIDSTAYYTRDSVAAIGMDTLGKTNVSHIVSVDATYGYLYNDTYINYETNGDISMYVGANSGLGGVTLPDWRTYAVQTHTTAGYKIADTTLTIPGIPLPMHLVVYDTTSYVNSGTFTAGTNNIPVYNLQDIITANGSALILSLTTHTDRHIVFAPSLGYIVSDITDPTKSPNTTLFPSQGGFQSVMTAYIQK